MLTFLCLILLGGAFADCGCAGGKTAPFVYETMPTNDAGGTCVGGCDGQPFSFHSYGSSVQTMMAWLGGDHNGIRALYVELFDGNKTVLGQIPAQAPDAQITLSQGETLTGDFQIDGNGIGTRTGFIAFKTSKGQTFQVGDQHTPYFFPSGESFLCGFFGTSSNELNQLGFYMMKTVVQASMVSVKYPTLSSYDQGLNPKVYKADLCNDDPSTPQNQEAIFTKTEGTDYSWSLSLSFSMGGSISFEAGIPFIAETKGEFHWEVGSTATYNQSEHNTHSEQMDFPVTVPPRSRILATFQWWDSQASVPYTGKLQYQFSDGSQVSFPVKDGFAGTYITDVTANYHYSALKPGEDCNQRIVADPQ